MLPRQLEYLDALARERHFGRAAEACHVSQPALSTGIRRLEEELGVRLVRRGRRFEGLTAEAEALLPRARAALDALGGLTDEAALLRGDLTGTLRIGHIPTVAAHMGELLGAFTADHPGLSVTLSTSPTDDLLTAIDGHDLDGALIYIDAPLRPGLDVVKLYRDRLVLLTSDQRWPARGVGPGRDRGPDVTWAQAAELPLCLLAPAMQNRQIIDRAFAAAGARAIARVEADSVAALIELGLAGGSCIVAEGWLRDRTLTPGARVHGLVDPPVAPVVGLATRAGPLASPAARLLRASLGRSRLNG